MTEPRQPLPRGRSVGGALFDFVRGSGAVDAAFGTSVALPPDPLDAVIGGVAEAFADNQRKPTSIVGRLKAAAAPKDVEEAKPESKMTPERKSDIDSQLEYIEFLDSLHSTGQLSAAQHAEQVSDAEADLAKLTEED